MSGEPCLFKARCSRRIQVLNQRLYLVPPSLLAPLLLPLIPGPICKCQCGFSSFRKNRTLPRLNKKLSSLPNHLARRMKMDIVCLISRRPRFDAYRERIAFGKIKAFKSTVGQVLRSSCRSSTVWYKRKQVWCFSMTSKKDKCTGQMCTITSIFYHFVLNSPLALNTSAIRNYLVKFFLVYFQLNIFVIANSAYVFHSLWLHCKF